MAMFRYEAVDSTGKMLRGVMQAADQTDLAGKLQARGFTLKNAYDNQSKSTATATVSPGPASSAPTHTSGVVPQGLQAVMIPPGIPVSIKSLVPARSLALYLRQLSTMVNAGIPLSQSIRENLPYIRDRRLNEASSQIADYIETGNKLSDAMARFPDIFPAHLIGAIVCGELGGDLDEYLLEAAADYEKESRDTYIARIGWGLTKLTLIQFWYAIPLALSTVPMLMGLIMSPEASNMTFMTVINAVLNHMVRVVLPIGTAATLVYVVLIYVVEAMKRKPAIKYTLDVYRSRMHPWGRLHRNRSIVRFLKSFDRLLSAGLDIGKAYEASSLLCRDNGVAFELRQGFVEPGVSISMTERLTRAGILKPEEIGLVSSSERAGKVGDALQSLAASYEQTDMGLVSFGRFQSIGAFIVLGTIISGVIAISITAHWKKMFDFFADGFI